ncbi:GNAT family N-acetyltransferase [Sporosarcina sp. Marseille-Q4063]|uniref:GNAT family N-acetyltransferase n=1 Tax=Sporosarcina sp. Marseille-Q4063 TaxID=2810514 RepID=UPI001BAFF9AE|nr:GNAT family N-acetyltransferase [Sporosarcina sp. Marseille-Q4063]QUW23747.1 GNAT family N-acetyltransferase [Sporosarcina sp. Marseille-Q4063]
MIRPMTSKDIDHVQQIARVTWRKTYCGIIPEELQTIFLERAYSDMMLMMRMEKTAMLIAESEGVPIGFANITKVDEDGDAELTAMYILPAHQHSGYGKKLFHNALSTLKSASQVFVYVEEKNEIGRAFYEKQGFKLLDVFEETFEGHPLETAQYVYSCKNH